MPRRDDVPDLGIDTTPRGPLRLGRRHRSLVPSSRVLGWSRAFFGAIVTLVLFGGGFLIEIAWDSVRPAAREETAADRWLARRRARELAPAPDAVDVAERERMDAQAEAEADEAREERLREAAKLINPVTPVVDSADLEGGRKQAFLQLHHSGNFYSSIVEGGACRQYAGEDRYAWETATPEDLAAMWAGRGRDGDFRVKSATRGAFSLSAVVVDRMRGRRFRLEMAGFDANGGTAVVEMTPLDP